MLQGLNVPAESALVRTLSVELHDRLPAGSEILPWRRGADFFALRVLEPHTTRELVLRVPLREVATSAYDGTVDFGGVVEREAFVHGVLRDHGVPVATLLDWGRAIGSGDHSWMLFERVQHDELTGLTPAEARSLGRVLSRVHAIRSTEAISSMIGAETTPGAMIERAGLRVGALADRVGYDDAVEILAGVRQVLYGRAGQIESCLTHLDVRVENLCFRDGRVIAVLDLSNCTTGDPAAELGRISAYGILNQDLLEAYGGGHAVDPVVIAAYAVDTFALLGLLGADEFADQSLVNRGLHGLNECLRLFRQNRVT